MLEAALAGSAGARLEIAARTALQAPADTTPDSARQRSDVAGGVVSDSDETPLEVVSLEQARAWLEDLVRQGETRACFPLGRLLRLGLGGPRDERRVAELWRRGAESGDALAMQGLGALHQTGGGGVPLDLDRATEWYASAVEAGNHGAASLLAQLYLMRAGRDMPADEARTRARRWLERGVEAGDPIAHLMLGNLYVTGSPAELDPARAARYWRVAAEAGLPDAQNNLGFSLLKGQGIARDVPAAIRWLRKAAEQNQGNAHVALASLYLRGVDVPRDLTRARRHAEAALAHGGQDAQALLDEVRAAERVTR